MLFNQLFKRLWTRRIELTLWFVIFSMVCTQSQYTWDVKQLDVCSDYRHWKSTPIATKTIIGFFFSLFILLNLISVIVGSLLLNFMAFNAWRRERKSEWARVSNVYLLWNIDIVFMLRCQNRISIDSISNVHLQCTSISAWGLL